MKQRQIIILVIGALILLGGIFINKKLAASKKAPKKEVVEKNTRKVNSLTVNNQNSIALIDITGKLVSENKIEVYSEVTGKLKSTNKAFKEGNIFQKGETLLEIDGEENRMNLLAQRSAFQSLLTQIIPDIRIDFPKSFSKWQDYINTFDVNNTLNELPETSSSKEKNYLAAKNIYNQYYSIKAQENRLDKFTIKAPFRGAVSQSMVNPGTIIRSGQKIGEFIDTKNYEFEATVHISDAKFIHVGDEVSLENTIGNKTWTAKVKRISQHLDSQSQSIKIYISVNGDELKEGMYLNGTIKGQNIANSFRIPRKLLIDKDKLYIIENDMLKLITIQIEKLSSTHIIVSNLAEGTKILAESGIGFYDGLEVNTSAN